MPGPTMADAPDTPAPDHAGHRARLRTRLLGGDADGMADYELVEYLLALAIPRRDTKPLAKALLREFGSIAQLVAADPASLRRIPGMGDTAAAPLQIVPPPTQPTPNAPPPTTPPPPP